MENKEELENLLLLSRLISYSIRIGDNLHKRFSKHLQSLKHVNNHQSKQKWIEEAFREKLNIHLEPSSEDVFKEKLVHFKLKAQMNNEIEKRIEIIKKFRNFSKTQWMLEAISDKLERDEEVVKKQLHEKINSPS